MGVCGSKRRSRHRPVCILMYNDTVLLAQRLTCRAAAWPQLALRFLLLSSCLAR
jgi:hypothetical protein